MSFDTEPFSSGSDDVPNDVVDVMTLLPVEPYGYEPEQVYMVDGVPIDGSGIDGYYGEGVETEGLVPMEEDPGWGAQGLTEYDLREEEEEEERERIRRQVDDAYEGGEDGFNHKGLVTADRKYKKDAFYAYKAWLSDEPFVHICGKRYRNRVEDVARVTVYSNQPTVELFANGASLGSRSAEDHFFRFDVPNAGETDLVAVAGDCRDASHITKVASFDESYRLKEVGALVNWFDITQPAGCCSVQDRVSEIKKNPEAAREVEGFFAPFAASMGMDAKSVMDMLGGFNVLRVCNLANQVLPDGKKVTGGDLLGLNARLNKIRSVP